MQKYEDDKKRVLLAVLAHPDDESFGLGGTLAYYAQKDVKVHLICATRGESGDMDEDCLDGFNTVAERRVFELECAAKILGLAGVHYLDYRDSGMPGSPENNHPRALAAAPVDQVADKIADLMRSIKPQVVLTFDPIGGYRHPDHIAINKATVKAYSIVAGNGSDWETASSSNEFKPQKLYFHVMPKRLFRLAVRLLIIFGKDPRRFGRNHDIDLLALVSEEEFPVHVKINIRSVLNLKEAAIACHASQLGGGTPRKGVISWLFRWASMTESFMRVYPEHNSEFHEEDLFEGINFAS